MAGIVIGILLIFAGALIYQTIGGPIGQLLGIALALVGIILLALGLLDLVDHGKAAMAAAGPGLKNVLRGKRKAPRLGPGGTVTPGAQGLKALLRSGPTQTQRRLKGQELRKTAEKLRRTRRRTVGGRY